MYITIPNPDIPPCASCPVLAICRSKEEIFCKPLYEYLCNYDKQGFLNYKKGRPRALRLFFNNDFYLMATRYSEWLIFMEEKGKGIEYNER